ncbi:LysR family transcriptional regulator [Streptomyces pactum]|uniref:LysR family transcriptional regulator n=1 Tax=Streptomyces pactum TaxID=68249 RepID=A0ABS0NNJ8_9ACTN|nr:LysR family transcriptional regulator [Streptomyces pactum]MBH5336778.1 LysR family transcriptional regulator [Streptomyces pactum]
MDLQLRHLRNLCAIADAGSLNRAATALGLPQPALSRQVRRLEQLLGGPLFERDSGGVRPTPLGAGVLDHAGTILRLSDGLGEQLRGHQLSRRGTVRVGWATSALHEPFLRCLRRLPCAGGVRVVTTHSSRTLAALLRSGEVDLALRDHCDGDEPLVPPGTRTAAPGPSGGPVPGGGPVSEVVWAESPVRLALAASHPLATAPVITMADLAEEEWISAYGPDDCSEKLRELCGAYGFTPRISHDVPVCGPRSEVIRHQGGIALTQALRPVGPGVVRRDVIDLALRVRHSIAFRNDSPFAAHVPLLARELAAAYRELAGAAPPDGGTAPRGPAPAGAVLPDLSGATVTGGCGIRDAGAVQDAAAEGCGTTGARGSGGTGAGGSGIWVAGGSGVRAAGGVVPGTAEAGATDRPEPEPDPGRSAGRESGPGRSAGREPDPGRSAGREPGPGRPAVSEPFAPHGSGTSRPRTERRAADGPPDGSPRPRR